MQAKREPEVEPTETKPAVSDSKQVLVIRRPSQRALGIGLIILVAVISFAAGSGVEHYHDRGRTTVATGFGQAGYGMGPRRLGGLGSVTAVSSSSISVQNQRTGTTRTYTITSTTTVDNNGTASSVSAIQVGDIVRVQTSSSTSTTATSITINPSTPYGPSGYQGSGSNGTI